MGPTLASRMPAARCSFLFPLGDVSSLDTYAFLFLSCVLPTGAAAIRFFPGFVSSSSSLFTLQREAPKFLIIVLEMKGGEALQAKHFFFAAQGDFLNPLLMLCRRGLRLTSYSTKGLANWDLLPLGAADEIEVPKFKLESAKSWQSDSFPDSWMHTISFSNRQAGVAKKGYRTPYQKKADTLLI